MWSRITAFFNIQIYDDPKQNRLVRNLHALLWVFIPGSILPFLNQLFILGEMDSFAIAAIILFVFTVFFIVLVRQGQITIPSYGMSILFLFIFTYVTVTRNGYHDIAFPGFVLVVLLAGWFTGRRGVIINSLLTILVTVGIGIAEITGIIQNPFSSATLPNDVVNMGILFTIIGFITYLLVDNLLKLFDAEHQTNIELQTLSQSLEKKVNERVRELTLATQAGNQIARERDLDVLLLDAVTLVRDLFDLYYVQVYLIDAKANRLVIQSGTGNVGARLVENLHSLPINRTSLNGQAAVEKQAVFVEDTAVNPNFRPNPLLPETRSEMAVPLMIGEDILGVLNLQDNKIGVLDEEGLPAFQTVANQLAIAIQNANLFRELTIARQEVEETARRLTRESWQNYMDGINEPQKIGVQYAQNEVRPLAVNELLPERENVLNVPVTIANEPLGVIAVENKENQPLNDEMVDMITAVSQQISQQIENLRLLGEAERYRTEAENVNKRLVREAWKTFRADVASDGFEYDKKQVKPIQSIEEELVDAEISAPLDIQGEMIGQLFLEGVNPEDESAFYLVGVIADHLSAHIENLRLNQQTEMALAESQRQREELAVINEIAGTVAAQLEVKALLESVLQQLKRVLPTDSFTAATYDSNRNELDFLLVYDSVNGFKYDLPPSLLEPDLVSYSVVHDKKPKLILFTEEEVQALRQNRPKNMIDENASITSSLLFAPMMRGDDVVGILSVQSYQLNAYIQSDLELFTGVANYVATGLQNAQLFSEIQSQSEKEHTINVITQKIQGTLTMEDALQTAVSELGNLLKARYTQVELDTTKVAANQ